LDLICIGECIHSLLNKEGSLLAAAPVDYQPAQVIAAIVANIWQSYTKTGDVDVMLLDLQEGNVAVTKVSNLLVCSVGTNASKPGMLRAKVLYCSLPIRPTTTTTTTTTTCACSIVVGQQVATDLCGEITSRRSLHCANTCKNHLRMSKHKAFTCHLLLLLLC
jgi:hypothetical protein